MKMIYGSHFYYKPIMKIFSKNRIEKSKPKVFCIGNNKTGTTSMQKYFKDHGFNVGNQREAELLIDDYIFRNWKPIVDYCRKYEAFQDIPFSNRFTYTVMDIVFPGSKFILTVRDDADQWYNSISTFHGKRFSTSGDLATKADLLQGDYVYKGWIWKAFSEKFGDFEDPYNKERLMSYYLQYNEDVRTYFKNKTNFLEVNLSQPNAVKLISDFLGILPKYDAFPHENKTII